MVTIYTATPPTPDSLTDSQVTTLRRYLEEEAVQAFGAALDSAAVSGSQTLDVRAFGTGVGTGSETSDTDAIQAAFAELSKNISTGVGGVSGKIYLPRPANAQRYYLADTVVFRGGNALSLVFYGDRWDGSVNGSFIQWTGDDSDDSVMFNMYGVSNSIIENIGFNGDDKAGKLLWMRSAQSLTGGGSCTFNMIRDCAFTHVKGLTGICIPLGEETMGDTYQVDQMYIYDNTFTGALSRTGIGVKQIQAGNTKNLEVRGGTQFYLEKAVVSGGSGCTTFTDCRMGEIGTVYTSAGECTDYLKGLQVEGCNQFVDAPTGTNNGKIVVQSCIVYNGAAQEQVTNQPGIDDDTMIEMAGSLVMHGNGFYNNGLVSAWTTAQVVDSGVRRKSDTDKIYESISGGTCGVTAPTGTSKYQSDGAVLWKYVSAIRTGGVGRVPKIVCGGASEFASVESKGNFFSYTNPGDWAPIYDGSGNNCLGSHPVNAYAQVSTQNVTSQGDKGGDINSIGIIRLLPAQGDIPGVNTNMVWTPNGEATIAGLGELHVGMNRLTFTYADFTAAAHDKELLVCQMPRCMVRFTGLDVTAAFVGTGLAACTAKLSTSANGSEIIAATDVMATGLIGDAVAELNTAAGKFWEVATCHPGGGKTVAANSAIYLRIDGDVNLSLLTAGTITVMIEIARLA